MIQHSLESPRVEPANENPEGLASLLTKVSRNVGCFIFIMSSDMLDILEYRVNAVVKTKFSNVDRIELYSLILNYDSLIPPIKKGLRYCNNSSMIMDYKDSIRIEKLEQSVKALKRQLEEPSLDALRRVGLRS